MLILSRKKGESLDIDGPCRIHIMTLTDGRVRVGIEAKKEVNVVRTEILEREDSGGGEAWGEG